MLNGLRLYQTLVRSNGAKSNCIGSMSTGTNSMMTPAATKLNPNTSNVEVSSLKPLFFQELTVVYPNAVSRKIYAEVYISVSQPIRYGPHPKMNQVTNVKKSSTPFESDSVSGEMFDG